MLKERRTEQQTIVRQVEDYGCEDCETHLYTSVDGYVANSTPLPNLRVTISSYGREALYKEFVLPVELCPNCMAKRIQQVMDALDGLGLKKVPLSTNKGASDGNL